MTDMNRYVVIDDFNGLINLVVDPEDGMTKVFDTKEEAQAEADECQDGIVVPLCNVLPVLKEASHFVDSCRMLLGEDCDPDDIEGQINSILGT